MKITSREIVLGLLTLMVGLFGGTFLVMRPRLVEWQRLEQAQKRLEDEIRRDRELVEKREEWQARFDALKDVMPQHNQEQKTDVLWLSTIDSVARKYGLEILKIDVGNEEQEGEIYELPIECKNWEGSLDSLIHFLFDLQARGAMLDVRYLVIEPKAGGALKGRFNLSCAYTRGLDAVASKEPE